MCLCVCWCACLCVCTCVCACVCFCVCLHVCLHVCTAPSFSLSICHFVSHYLSPNLSLFIFSPRSLTSLSLSISLARSLSHFLDLSLSLSLAFTYSLIDLSFLFLMCLCLSLSDHSTLFSRVFFCFLSDFYSCSSLRSRSGSAFVALLEHRSHFTLLCRALDASFELLMSLLSSRGCTLEIYTFYKSDIQLLGLRVCTAFLWSLSIPGPTTDVDTPIIPWPTVCNIPHTIACSTAYCCHPYFMQTQFRKVSNSDKPPSFPPFKTHKCT